MFISFLLLIVNSIDDPLGVSVGPWTNMHRRFQTRASPGIARVKFWSIVHIAYHYIVLRDDGAESFDSKDNRQSKARSLGGGTGFFSTHKPTARAARAACPGNLAAL